MAPQNSLIDTQKRQNLFTINTQQKLEEAKSLRLLLLQLVATEFDAGTLIGQPFMFESMCYQTMASLAGPAICEKGPSGKKRDISIHTKRLYMTFGKLCLEI